jgi:hypothetical protein
VFKLIDVEQNGYSTSFMRKIITRVLDIRLEKMWWRWKANSKIYKVMFHEIWLIPIFARSKRAAKSSLESVSEHGFFMSGHVYFYVILRLLFFTCPDSGHVLSNHPS